MTLTPEKCKQIVRDVRGQNADNPLYENMVNAGWQENEKSTQAIIDAALLVCYCPSAGGYYAGPSAEDGFEQLQRAFDDYYGFQLDYDVNVWPVTEEQMRKLRTTPPDKVPDPEPDDWPNTRAALLKDHEIAQLTNTLRDIAIEYHDTQQLRARISAVILPIFKGSKL